MAPKPQLLVDAGRPVELRLDQGLPLLNQFSEEGFVDCVFSITRLRREARHFRMKLGAGLNGSVLGFEVRVPRGLAAGLDANAKLIQANVCRGGIEFRRSGVESDRLLVALAKLYKLRVGSRRFALSTFFTGIVLRQGKVDVEREPVKVKLFGHDEPHDPKLYNESFLNLDLANGFVFWNEKDQEYRKAIVRSLGA